MSSGSDPGSIIPGHQAMAGTGIPPSVMSALLPKADISNVGIDVRYVTEADVGFD
jgi:hypothetical protein